MANQYRHGAARRELQFFNQCSIAGLRLLSIIILTSIGAARDQVVSLPGRQHLPRMAARPLFVCWLVGRHARRRGPHRGVLCFLAALSVGVCVHFGAGASMSHYDLLRTFVEDTFMFVYSLVSRHSRLTHLFAVYLCFFFTRRCLYTLD